MSLVTAFESLPDRISSTLAQAVFRKSAFDYVNEHNRLMLVMFQSYCVPGTLSNIASPAGFNLISVVTADGTTRHVTSDEMNFFYCIFLVIGGCTDMGYEFRKLHNLDHHLHCFFTLIFGIKKRTNAAFLPHVTAMVNAFRERPFAASNTIYGEQRDFQMLVDNGFIHAEMHLMRRDYKTVSDHDDDDEDDDVKENEVIVGEPNQLGSKRSRTINDAMDEIEYLKKRNTRLQAVAEARTNLCCDYFDVLGLNGDEAREEFLRVDGQVEPRVRFLCSDEFLEGRVTEFCEDDV